MLWLLDQFRDYDLLKSPVVLPEEKFFPDPFSGTEECVRRMVDRVCGYMRVDPARLRVALFSDKIEWPDHLLPYYEQQGNGAAGLYMASDGSDQIVIALESAQIKDPASLVATIAHELGHVLLLGDGRISREDPDHEPLTDLLTVVFGMGVFNANAAFKFEQWDNGGKHGWHASRKGYLSQEMFGYALAAYSNLRGDTRPPWIRHLSYNVKVYFMRSLRYLPKQGQSVDL